MFDADHLHLVGLINQIFDTADELEAGAQKFVANLAALDPIAVQMTKETQRATTGMPIADALVMSKHLNALLMSSGRINEAAEFFDNVGDRIDDGAGCPWNRLDMCPNIRCRGQERQS